MAKSKSKQKVTYTDDAFLSRYYALNEHRSELARELGISPAAVTQRLRRIGRDKIEAAREVGQAAVMIAKALDKPVKTITQQAVNQVAFNRGIQDAVDELQVLEGLNDLYMDIKAILEGVKAGIAASKTGRAKPFEVEQICKLIGRAESLKINAHKMKLEMLKADGTQVFMRVMLNICLEEMPDVRERLYKKLADFGFEGQVLVIDAGSGPSTPSD